MPPIVCSSLLSCKYGKQGRCSGIISPRIGANFASKENTPFAMEMKKINSGKLRAIGYDARARLLQVQLDDGSTLQYSGVGEDIWRRFSTSGAAWSFYRDNIEEEFTGKRVSGSAPAGKNPLDELFRKT